MNNKIEIRFKAILVALEELEPCTAAAVVSKLKMGRRQVYASIKELTQLGYIVAVGGLLYIKRTQQSVKRTQMCLPCTFSRVLLVSSSCPLACPLDSGNVDFEYVADKKHINADIYIYTNSNNNTNSNNIYSNSYSKKEKNAFMKKKKETSESSGDYMRFMKVYYDFVYSKNGVPPKITAADGKALKDIIAYLIGICEGDSERALNGFKAIFDRWYLLDNYTKDRIRLIDINSQMNNIISQIKAGGVKKGSVNLYDSIDSKIKSE
jgi:hypothetical protein